MKKIIAGLFSVLLIFAAFIPVYADETEVPEMAEDVVLFAAEDVPQVDEYYAAGSVEEDVYEIAQYGDDAELENEEMMEISNEPVEKGFSFRRLVAAVILGFIIGLIALKIVASPLKSVTGQSNANQYAVKNSFKLNYSNDVFLYKNVEKRAKPQQNQQPKK